MNKKFKTLLTAGLITVIAGSSIVSSSALSKKVITNYKTKGAIYLVINGKKYKISLGCNNKPSQNGDSSIGSNNNSNTGNDNNQDNNNSNTGNDNNQGNNDSNTGNDNNQGDSDSSIGNDNNQDNNNSNTGNDNNQGNSDSNIGNDNNQDNNNSNTGNDNNQDNDNVVEKPSDDNNTSNDNQTTTGSFLSFQKEVTRLVNVERSKRGLSELSFNTQLSNVATIKSQDMINKNYFDHTSPTYGSPFDMMKQFNISYRTAGENIAKGQTSPAQVVNSWMNSSGHRANILNANFTDIGIGVAKSSNGTLYWTQMFIGK